MTTPACLKSIFIQSRVFENRMRLGRTLFDTSILDFLVDLQVVCMVVYGGVGTEHCSAPTYKGFGSAKRLFSPKVGSFDMLSDSRRN